LLSGQKHGEQAERRISKRAGQARGAETASPHCGNHRSRLPQPERARAASLKQQFAAGAQARLRARRVQARSRRSRDGHEGQWSNRGHRWQGRGSLGPTQTARTITPNRFTTSKRPPIVGSAGLAVMGLGPLSCRGSLARALRAARFGTPQRPRPQRPSPPPAGAVQLGLRTQCVRQASRRKNKPGAQPAPSHLFTVRQAGLRGLCGLVIWHRGSVLPVLLGLLVGGLYSSFSPIRAEKFLLFHRAHIGSGGLFIGTGGAGLQASALSRSGSSRRGSHGGLIPAV